MLIHRLILSDGHVQIPLWEQDAIVKSCHTANGAIRTADRHYGLDQQIGDRDL